MVEAFADATSDRVKGICADDKLFDGRYWRVEGDGGRRAIIMPTDDVLRPVVDAAARAERDRDRRGLNAVAQAAGIAPADLATSISP